jgi:glutamate racemase
MGLCARCRVGAVGIQVNVTGMTRNDTILVFDSGLGGLTVFREIVKARPDAEYIYLADDAAFPYGGLSEAALVARVEAVFQCAIAEFSPDIAVIACNTASTLVLPHLRAAFQIPFVGTVPAIKPAVEASLSRLVSVLATPGTVKRDYTLDLVSRFSGNAEVTLVGAPRLAALAEAHLRGEAITDHELLNEIRPCFITAPDGRRTDQLVLACTHYPLLSLEIERLSPWPVTLVDPAAAIARRVVSLVGPPKRSRRADRIALFTGHVPQVGADGRAFRETGLSAVDLFDVPFGAQRATVSGRSGPRPGF